MAEEKKVRGQIHFRITPEEAAIIEQKAAAVNLSPTMYAKKMAVQGKVKPQVISKDLGQAMLPHISHMGSNINQLAKRANGGGTVAAAELAEVKAEFEALWDLVLYGKKPHRSAPMSADGSSEQKAPRCEICGAELKAGERKADNSPIWYCPNWKEREQGKHTILERE